MFLGFLSARAVDLSSFGSRERFSELVETDIQFAPHFGSIWSISCAYTASTLGRTEASND